MPKKKKIFICNDASFIGSGYGVYGKELLTRLHNTGKYEIAELGCYATVESKEIKNIPWKFYPNAVNSTDERNQKYKESPINQFGSWRFNSCVMHFKPDIVFDVRDYWMSSYQEISPLRKYFSWVLMPTVDSAPQKIEWLYTFCNADVVIPYTQWARNILSNSCGKKINLFHKHANAGINPQEFFPLPNKKSLKEKYFGNQNATVIGTVMRNQKRKLFDDLMVAFRQYLDRLILDNNIEEYNKTFLYLHTSFPEQNGWDLPTLLYENRILDKTYFTYVCKSCKHYFPSKYQNCVLKCPKCKTHACTLSNVVNGTNTDQLNEIYNLFDLYVQYAICEGFGMPQIEAASCGIPIMSVDYSAMTEIVENLDGIKIPLSRLYREMESNAYRAYPDIDKTTDEFYTFFIKKNDEFRKQKELETRKKCIEIYNWDNVAKVWDECFESLETRQRLKWDEVGSNPTNHANISVEPGLNPKEFVEFICDNIINEPNLKHTASIRCLIRDLSQGIVSNNGNIRSFSYPDAIKILENHLNNKININSLIENKSNIKNQDYFLL